MYPPALALTREQPEQAAGKRTERVPPMRRNAPETESGTSLHLLLQGRPSGGQRRDPPFPARTKHPRKHAEICQSEKRLLTWIGSATVQALIREAYGATHWRAGALQ